MLKPNSNFATSSSRKVGGKCKGEVPPGDVIYVPRGSAGEFAGISNVETRERNSLALGWLDPHQGPQGQTASIFSYKVTFLKLFLYPVVFELPSCQGCNCKDFQVLENLYELF